MCQRNIFSLEVFNITHHFGFGVVAVKDRMREEFRSAELFRTKGNFGRLIVDHEYFGAARSHCKNSQQFVCPIAIGCFVDTDTDFSRFEIA